MTYVKKSSKYLQLPFCNNTPTGSFYKFMSVSTLCRINIQTSCVHQKYRTIGVLQSINGQYVLKNIDRHDSNERYQLRVSFEYSPTPPPPAIVPYTVQLFGALDAFNSPPVLYVSVIMPIPHEVACSLMRLMQDISNNHLAVVEIE